MRRARFAGLVLPVVVATLSMAAHTAAPAQSPPPMGRDEIATLAKAQIAIARARDSTQAQLAHTRNTKPESQQQLREKLRTDIEAILHHHGLTEAEYQRKTYQISTDTDARKTFDSVVVAVTGQPIPGQVQPGAGRGGAPVSVPAGPAGTHIGHVVNAFSDTPEGLGLLPAAVAEARIAAQHATLATRNTANLDAMKLHAGHVIHALDPTVVTMGPGLGYGVKKAATGIVMHIELAGKAAGASANIGTHSTHIATSARNTMQRADSIVALAKQVLAATGAPEAAALLSQIVSLADQLATGFDANGDGRVGWQEGEGGLQQAQEHVTLMLAAEKPPG